MTYLHPSHIDYDAYGFSGPRRLTSAQQECVHEFLEEFPYSEYKKPCLVGDAKGLDAIIRESITWNQFLFEVEGRTPADFAKRTLRMIDALAEYDKPCLYVFPNKPCPVGCKPAKNPSGKGSGTWLAAAAATYRGITVKYRRLEYFRLPEWAFNHQLSLF